MQIYSNLADILIEKGFLYEDSIQSNPFSIYIYFIKNGYAISISVNLSDLNHRYDPLPLAEGTVTSAVVDSYYLLPCLADLKDLCFFSRNGLLLN